jgi:diguanylate cyclase (GGDEF)-like protein
MTKSFSNIKQGDTCYKAIMGYNTVCENCPAVMLNDRVDKQTSEIYSKYRHAWFSTTASKLDSDSGSQECLLCLTNVTQFMDRVQSHDKLTGILTFDKFEIDCMSNFEKLSDNYFVASVKLVRFGDINDEYGFETGNLVLKEIASKFSRTVMKDEAVCRANGANFFALLKADVYWKVENRLNALFISISDSLKEMIPDIQISMVAGIYQITPEDKQFNSCLDKANFVKKKLTDKKFVNKNEILTYDKTLDDELSARKDIERNMYNALENNEFKVFYQPKVSLENEKIYGAEALVRWIKADGEIISPELFVPIFEENEFVVEMDFYVYDVVMRDMTKLLQEGFELPIISLNVSKQHFYDGEFTEKFTSLVDSYGIPHEYIELELTETTFFGNLDHMIEIINHLRMDLGFRVSVDDFGSGYSSLNLISVLPVDVLKIDGKFFMTNKMSTKNKKVIETILQLATTLNFDTVSEGVETEEQVEFLKKTNCDAVQGYFYYRPMKFEDFKALLK